MQVVYFSLRALAIKFAGSVAFLIVTAILSAVTDVDGWRGIWMILFIFIGLPLTFLTMIEFGSACRSVPSPSKIVLLFGYLLGVPQAFFGLLSVGIGLTIIVWVIYNSFIEKDPVYSGGFLTFGIGPALVFFGVVWLRYAFSRETTSRGEGIEDVTPPNLACPELDASITKARETMPLFVAEVEKGIDDAYIKFPLLTPQGLTEHIWAYVHFHKDGQFNVSLANDPIDEKVEAGGRRNVPIEQVEDWQIVQPDGKIRGAYSLIALFLHREREGKPLSPRMKTQEAQLLDAAS